jgi:pilus assembly protein CpaC
MNAGVFLGRNQNGNVLTVSGPSVLNGVSSSGDGGGSGGGFSGTGFAVNSGSGFLPRADAFNLVLGNAGAGLLSALSALESNGFAYTLATPTLSVLSGQSASFLAGGELPIPQRSGSGGDSGISISYREFGVKLQVTATVLDNNRIALKVAPEVSEPDLSLAVSSGGVTVPGFVVRKSDTTLMLGDGESFVIGGLFSRNVGNIVDKFPGLAEVPILGAFFRSKNFDSQDKELLMVVTTHLVKPLAAGTQLPALPGERYRTYNPDFGKFLLETEVVGDNHLPVGLSEGGPSPWTEESAP